MHALRPARRARDARHRLARDLRRDARRAAPRRTAASTSAWAISGRTTCAGSSRAWSSAAPTAASISPAGRVEVVPTAHYMMGGVVFAPDCTTALPGCSRPARIPAACTARTGSAATASPTRPCSAASPATRWRRGSRATASWREPDEAALERTLARAEAPLSGRRGDPAALEAIRERLYDVMWDDVGIVRDGAGLARAARDARRRSTTSSPGIGVAGRRARVQPHLARLRSTSRT